MSVKTIPISELHEKQLLNDRGVTDISEDVDSTSNADNAKTCTLSKDGDSLGKKY